MNENKKPPVDVDPFKIVEKPNIEIKTIKDADMNAMCDSALIRFSEAPSRHGLKEASYGEDITQEQPDAVDKAENAASMYYANDARGEHGKRKLLADLVMALNSPLWKQVCAGFLSGESMDVGTRIAADTMRHLANKLNLDWDNFSADEITLLKSVNELMRKDVLLNARLKQVAWVKRGRKPVGK